MKIGTLAYACWSGLGILAKAFYDHGIVTDVAVIHHGRHETFPEWYPNGLQVTNLKSQRQQIHQWCREMDAMLFFETPFLWELLPFCRTEGIKTILMPMHECFHEAGKRADYAPDLMLCPSELDLKEVGQYGKREMFLPVPVDTEKVKWRQRNRAEVFVHNAGHGGLKGRNGTKEIIEAWRQVKTPARLIIRTQSGLQSDEQMQRNAPGGMMEVRTGAIPYSELWATGDCLIFPEKFNGLSLPLQEARAAGMLVMCGDRFPMNTWLPREPLIPVTGYRRQRVGPPYHEFDEAIITPEAIARKMDEFYGKDISAYSQAGREWAEANSWHVLGPKYLEVIETLIKKG